MDGRLRTTTIKQEAQDPLKLAHYESTYKDFHKCHQCQYRTKSSFSLRRHLKRHQKQMPLFDCTKSILTYKCDKCNFRTHLTYNFVRHVCNQENIVPYEAVQFTCSSCDFCTHSHLILLKHLGDCVDDDIDKEAMKCLNMFNSNRKEYFKCYQFLTQIRYLRIERLKCDQCPYMARMLGDLRTHMEKVHFMNSQLKWFECEPCLFNVEQIFHLRKHVLMEHGEDVPGLDY